MRIQFITETLACGGAINDKNAFNVVKGKGITHIINLTRVCYGADKLETLHYLIPDDGTQRPNRLTLVCLLFALDVLKDPKNKLFVHCSAGRNRSVSLCYGILRCLGDSPQEAENRLRKDYFGPLHARDKNFKDKEVLIRYKNDIERVLSLYSFLTVNNQ